MSYKTIPGALGLLAPIKNLLENPGVAEIIVNQPGQVVFEQEGVFHTIKVEAFNKKLLGHLFQLIARESHQLIDVEHPLLSANLSNGLRIQLVLPPTAVNYTFSLRKQSVTQLSLDDYQRQGLFKLKSSSNNKANSLLLDLYRKNNYLSFIKLAIKLKKNIVISGGTSTGKTTFLNACLQEIDNKERLVLIEDVREMFTPHANQVQLLTSKGGQGKASISIQELIQCSLRLRPDRIICGEIRGKEIIDFISACSTGHPGSMTTIHANSPQGAFARMMQLYKLNHVSAMTDENILSEIRQVVDIIIQLSRGPGGRFISDIFFCDSNN